MSLNAPIKAIESREGIPVSGSILLHRGNMALSVILEGSQASVFFDHRDSRDGVDHGLVSRLGGDSTLEDMEWFAVALARACVEQREKLSLLGANL